MKKLTKIINMAKQHRTISGALGGTITKGLSTVGKSAATKNAALASELAATKLKTKLTLEAVKSRAKTLGAKAMVNPAKAKYAGKVATKSGMGAVVAAGAYGVHRIRKAKKEFDKANAAQIKAQEEGSKMAVKATKELIAKRKKYAKNKNR